jgi:hypothetical protein
LTKEEYCKLSGGSELNDNHINAAQFLLKLKFPEFHGFSHTLKPTRYNIWKSNYIQILHCRGNHWILLSTIGCKTDEMFVYDSLYKTIDEETETTIKNIFGSSYVNISLPIVQSQSGVKDCGVFSIAFATFLAFT